MSKNKKIIIAISVITILIIIILSLITYREEPKMGAIKILSRQAMEVKTPLATYLVKISDNFGYIEKNGNFVITSQFEQANSFSEGYVRIRIYSCHSATKWFFINKSGNSINNREFDFRDNAIHGLAFDFADNFSEDLAVVEIKNKFGFINKTGKYVIKPTFDWADSFSEGIAAVCTQFFWINKCGYIDKTGK